MLRLASFIARFDVARFGAACLDAARFDAACFGAACFDIERSDQPISLRGRRVSLSGCRRPGQELTAGELFAAATLSIHTVRLCHFGKNQT